MGDVTYGACCVDDYTAKALGIIFKSILIYTFLFFRLRFAGTLRTQLFGSHSGHCRNPHALCFCQYRCQRWTFYWHNHSQLWKGKINCVCQYCSVPDFSSRNFNVWKYSKYFCHFQMAKNELVKQGYNVFIPQCSPLSPGEILGCTSPKLPADTNTIMYIFAFKHE